MFFLLDPGCNVEILLSASNDQEWTGWCNALEQTIDYAREKHLEVDTELTPYEQEIGMFINKIK